MLAGEDRHPASWSDGRTTAGLRHKRPTSRAGDPQTYDFAINRFSDQLESLYGISVQIAGLRGLSEIYDLALTYCLALTHSEMGFIGLLTEDRIDMDVVSVKGFVPVDPKFYERFKRLPVRPSVFGRVIVDGRPSMSDDVESDPGRVGQPPGHPTSARFSACRFGWAAR